MIRSTSSKQFNWTMLSANVRKGNTGSKYDGFVSNKNRIISSVLPSCDVHPIPSRIPPTRKVGHLPRVVVVVVF